MENRQLIKNKLCTIGTFSETHEAHEDHKIANSAPKVQYKKNMKHRELIQEQTQLHRYILKAHEDH